MRYAGAGSSHKLDGVLSKHDFLLRANHIRYSKRCIGNNPVVEKSCQLQDKTKPYDSVINVCKYLLNIN